MLKPKKIAEGNILGKTRGDKRDDRGITKMKSGKVVVVEARQTFLGLQFKKVVTKECKPVSPQIQNFSAMDLCEGEQRL